MTAAWNAVLEFFGGLNLFESGAKLLSTFVDGIKSMASSVVESVEGVFTKVREYLPFSDAHVGPLSQLTLSGARMMSTLAEGVTSGQGGLVARVSGALSGVGGAIRDWWKGLGNPVTDTVPKLPTPPTTGVPVMPEVAAPKLPVLPPLEVQAGKLPEMPVLTVAAPTVPEPEAPEIAIPQAPSFDLTDPARTEGNVRSGGQSITIYGDIVLPSVQKAEDFGEAMRQYLQGEISMMEGMA